MGGVFSEQWPANERMQQQRAQLLLLSQLRSRPDWGEGAEGFGALRPVAQPSLRQTQVCRNPLHLRGKSLRLLHSEPGPRWELFCDLDSSVPCEVRVLLGSAVSSFSPPDLESGEGATTSSSSSWGWISPTYRFPEPGLGLGVRVQLGVEREVTKNTRLPLCIELLALEAVDSDTKGGASDTGQRAAEWTFGHINCPERLVELNTQRVRLPGADGFISNFEMHEVFGAETQGPTLLCQDCVICMAERRDTAVLPCRHMCLCGGCAETMRSRVQYRAYRCPICRERVSSLLQLRKPEVPESAAVY